MAADQCDRALAGGQRRTGVTGKHAEAVLPLDDPEHRRFRRFRRFRLFRLGGGGLFLCLLRRLLGLALGHGRALGLLLRLDAGATGFGEALGFGLLLLRPAAGGELALGVVEELHQRDVRGADVGAGAAADAVHEPLADGAVEVAGADVRGHGQRHQAAGAGADAARAADAGRGRALVGLRGGEREHAVAALHDGHAQLGQRLPHHRPAADELRGRLGEAAAVVHQRLHAGADGHAQVLRLRDRLPGDGDDAGDERPAMAQRLVHGKRRRGVVHHHADVRREPARGRLAARQRLHQVFLGAHRVARRELHHLDAREGLCGVLQRGDGLGLVGLDADDEWENMSTEQETRVRFSRLYKNAAESLFFELRNV